MRSELLLLMAVRRARRYCSVTSLRAAATSSMLSSSKTAPIAILRVSRRRMWRADFAITAISSWRSPTAPNSVSSSEADIGCRSSSFSNQAAASGIFSKSSVARRLLESTCVMRSAAPVASRSIRKYQGDSPRSSERRLKANRAASGSVPRANHSIKTGSNCF